MGRNFGLWAFGCVPTVQLRSARWVLHRHVSFGNDGLAFADLQGEMASICLVTSGHLSTNPRIVKEADCLAEAGHQVTVLATRYLAWAEETDALFAGRGWVVAPPVKFGPRAPILTRATQIARQRLARLAVDGARMKHHSVVNADWHQATLTLVRAAKRIQADLYIAHYPAALPAAALAARHNRARYAYDAEDFHLGDPAADNDRDRRMISLIESRWLPGCAYMTAASPGIADAYVENYGVARPHVVLNVFPKSHAPSGATPRGTARPGPSLYWFSQTIGPDRGLECAMRAVGAAHSALHLYVRGKPATGFEVRLRAIAREIGASDRLHFLPIAPPPEMERLAGDLEPLPGRAPRRDRLPAGEMWSVVTESPSTASARAPRCP